MAKANDLGCIDGRVTAMQGNEEIFTLDLDVDEALDILDEFDAGGGEVTVWCGIVLLAIRMADGNVLRFNRGQPASA